MKIAENLKKLREKKGLSQMQLAEKAGVNQSMIAHIENGLKLPSLAVTISLSQVLGVTLDELCMGA
ncbi:Helix-turn-helix [Ruminococcaceae bacterium P7]|nr:Helix-turn-helix [Ruminococcaceae bacterium P7]